MEKSDLKKFSEIIFFLADNFSANLREGAIEMRFQALKEYSIIQIQKAASSIIKTRKYTKMPTIADFIEHIDGSSEDRSVIESLKVWNAISGVGAYESVAFDDPITMAVIEQGFQGWVKLCGDQKDGNRTWFCRDFEKIYKSFKASGVKKYGKLIGIIEFQNGEKGCLDNIPATKLIGDPGRAEAVRIGNEGNTVKKLTDGIG